MEFDLTDYILKIFTVDQENNWFDDFLRKINNTGSKYRWHKDFAIDGEEKLEQDGR